MLKGISYTREEIENEVSIVVGPDPEPSEDWAALIENAVTVDDLHAVGERLKEKGEGTDSLRAKFAARLGVLKKDVVDAEVVNDEPDATVESADADTPEPALDQMGSGDQSV